ncbi:hypothetical protein BCR33DRAFT_783510 [Rhizoclosmatium globosum]|uniref:HTH APSES-type domain-containing protein n=1 Tax=Rhizoclosmatium globosum TaxID=329046 RepID=A0A1Y2CH02_9FUNG|nr:hypothetical protein BCR33DRAFT_783510 [Rhizoclosmatium globosum]|eukprot:ORY46331.1 hypothetical protein BCR33DRAFT_783510 [Rhizoclosmatium globosum]
MTAKDAEVTIKTSTYSNTPVIELIYKGMSVLRRSGYLAINGTQILTIGGVTERAKRARILDVKCIGEGWPVEKVQGGAGKFQGTWMPVVHALQLAKDYGVEKIVQQLVDYVPPANSAAASVISVQKKAVYNPGSGTSTPVGQPGRRGRRKATDDGGNQVPAKKQRTDDSEDEMQLERQVKGILSLFISSTPQTTTATKKSWPDYLSLATPLDVKGNTAVHWAASLGHTDTLQEILAFAATHKDNPLTSVNYAQETALMRALHLPNNHIRKSSHSFPSTTKDLLHLKDAHNQTLFHHAVASVIASSISIEACVYYLSCIKDVFGLLHPAQEGAYPHPLLPLLRLLP